jgi:hypothetical protein
MSIENYNLKYNLKYKKEGRIDNIKNILYIYILSAVYNGHLHKPLFFNLCKSCDKSGKWNKFVLPTGKINARALYKSVHVRF